MLRKYHFRLTSDANIARAQLDDSGSRVIIATRQSVPDTVNEVGKKLTKKNLDTQPWLTTRPGFEVRIMVN